MTSNNNNKKYQKWSPEWAQEVTRLVGQEIEKKIKKGDQKPDGSTATAEETIKVNDAEHLLAQRKTLIAELETKKKVLQEKGGYTDTYVDLALRHDELAEQIAEWKTNLKSGSNYTKQYSDFFRKSSSSATDAYRTAGWIKLVSDYHTKKFTPSGATPQEYTNLYEVNLYTGNGSNQMGVKLTETEVIKLITRTLKEFEKIDKTEFDQLTTTPPTGLPPLTFTTTSANAGAIQGQLKILQDHAKNLVETTDKETGRKEYSFGHNFVSDDGTGMVDTPFAQAEIAAYFDLLDFLQKNRSWLNHADVKGKVCKDIPEKTELTFIPAQDTPYTEGKLHDWGYENYCDKKFKNSPKATAFYGDIPTSERETKAVKYEIEGGLEGWTKINNSAFQIDYNLNEGRKEKIISSFDGNPLITLFSQLRSVNEFGTFTDGTNNFTLHDFPKFFYEQQKELYRCKGLRDSELKRLDSGGDDLRKAQAEYDTAKQALKVQEKEIAEKITAKITELRNELKTKFQIDNTTAPSFGSGTDASDTNRLTQMQHYELQKLLSDIRFLKNNDPAIASEITHENTALQASNDIITACLSKWHSASWESIGWKVGGSEEENSRLTTEQRIAIIKANKPAADGKKPYDILNLNWWHDSLMELEKLVKLAPREQEIKTKLKVAIDQQTPQEQIQDWQNIVKKYEAGLATVFDSAKIAQWKEQKDGQDAFNNTVGIESLIKKVSVFEKEADGTTDKFKEINPDFLTFLQAQDNKLKTLTDLFQEKDPKAVILLIHQWEYNKLDDSKKKERWLKFAWSEKGGQQKIDCKDKLEDSEKDKFNEYLYECAIGKIKENSLTKPSEQEETPTENNGDKTGALNWINNHYWWPVWALLLVIVTGAVIFWKKIVGWWNGPAEEQAITEKTESTEEEDE